MTTLVSGVTPAGQEEPLACDVAGRLLTAGALGIPPHDYVGCSYTNGNMTGVVYKSGGSGGTTVATLAMTYDGNGNLLTVTRT